MLAFLEHAWTSFNCTDIEKHQTHFETIWPSRVASIFAQCFFKVFERVSWWSFRVSTSFSLLCVILLTHFHKNASFRPNMLNCWNTTFTFGKWTKDNFINRTVQCRRTCSFIYSFSGPLFLFRESWGSSLRRTRNTSRSTPISDSSGGTTSRRYQTKSEM